jgi:hypothetical protein
MVVIEVPLFNGDNGDNDDWRIALCARKNDNRVGRHESVSLYKAKTE